MQPDILYWLSPWEPSVTVVAVTGGAAALYIRGCRASPPSLLRQCCFWLGLLSFYIALHTQFDYYSEHEFFMHRIQHSILHHIAPFLIALSSPGKIFYAPCRKWRMPILSYLNSPVIAPLLFCGLILFWLIPSIHFLAMLDWRLYRIMNWSMAVNGLMFWQAALNSKQLPPGKRIIMMLAVIPPQIVVGMLVFAAPGELYPIYSICGRAFSLSPLADQQLGGLILWIPAAMMSVIGVLLVIWREWVHPAVSPAPGAEFLPSS